MSAAEIVAVVVLAGVWLLIALEWLEGQQR